MDPASLATTLLAARTAQVQMAFAARLAKQAHTMDASMVQMLVQAAEQSGQQLAAAAQSGMGTLVDVTA